jgi:hypothetical protein
MKYRYQLHRVGMKKFSLGRFAVGAAVLEPCTPLAGEYLLYLLEPAQRFAAARPPIFPTILPSDGVRVLLRTTTDTTSQTTDMVG